MSGLNWDKDFALEQAADDHELLEELVTIFKESIENDFAMIQKGLAAGDHREVCSGAHSIKGAAASLGILGIRDVAEAIEEDSREGSLSVAQSRIAELSELKDLLLAL
jgi:HPt (histidine-containing phosphotransfer) domain-containing protein